MRVTLVGRRRFAAKLRRAAKNSRSEMDRERKRCADDLLDASIPVTPMSAGENRGELRRSGYADHTTFRDASLVGFSAPYAVHVHEMGPDEPDDDPSDDPDGRINWTTPGTGKKFLEGPFAERKQIYSKRMKNAARRGLHG